MPSKQAVAAGHVTSAQLKMQPPSRQKLLGPQSMPKQGSAAQPLGVQRSFAGQPVCTQWSGPQAPFAQASPAPQLTPAHGSTQPVAVHCSPEGQPSTAHQGTQAPSAQKASPPHSLLLQGATQRPW
jgi:hypothetical protein